MHVRTSVSPSVAKWEQIKEGRDKRPKETEDAQEEIPELNKFGNKQHLMDFTFKSTIWCFLFIRFKARMG